MPFKYRSRIGSKSRTLKAKNNKTIKQFKSVDNYLDSVYRNNKEYLDKYLDVMGDSRRKKAIFKDQVKKYMNYVNPDTGKNYTIRQAIDRVQRSEMITTKEERIGEVRLERMKELDPQKYKDFRQVVGWKIKVNSMNFVEMTSQGNKNILRYQDKTTGSDIVLIETISPKTGVSQGYEIIDYGDYLEQTLKSSNDPASFAQLQVQKVLNRARADEINRIRKITQGKNYKKYE